MGNLDSILKGHAERLGIEKQVEAVGIVEKATEVIAKYIPREDFEVISFKAGILKVGVKNSVAGGELTARAGTIIKGLRAAKSSVNKLIIVNGSSLF